MKSRDTFFMQKALSLARKGLSWTFPNPLVGAVLVKNGKIIGIGYHRRAGFPHAEIEAMNKAGRKAEGATLYVNLEPCCHFGRTPPCTDAIIEAGVLRVVCAIHDPNPLVHGKGTAELKKTGVRVDVGLLVDEARILNEAFFTFHQKKRPFVAIKFASSLDGKIATRTGDSRWITNEKARLFARTLRSEYQAILVGINTVLSDNPHLGVRMKDKKDPIRIILDTTLKIPLNSQVLRDSNVFIATGKSSDKRKYNALINKGITILQFHEDTVPLNRLMRELRKRKIISILVEGGATVHGAFIDAGLVDKVYAFYAPVIIGGEKAKNAVGGVGVSRMEEALRLRNIRSKSFGDNFLIAGDTP